ncbi:MAG: UDP-glucose 6-dehydrogenase, partial [Phycisphaerales bacterium]|nr:UDP-glucose 6-dehydrogenase [Phycisphaerales bacterium]
RIVIWGLAFKPNTDDLREAPSIDVIEGILKAGGEVFVHDPRAIEAGREIFGDRIQYCEDAYEAIEGADALVTCTEWMEYRSPDFDRMRAQMRQPVIFDGRNIWDADIAARYGFEYYSVGRPPVVPKAAHASTVGAS